MNSTHIFAVILILFITSVRKVTGQHAKHITTHNVTICNMPMSNLRMSHLPKSNLTMRKRYISHLPKTLWTWAPWPWATWPWATWPLAHEPFELVPGLKSSSNRKFVAWVSMDQKNYSLNEAITRMPINREFGVRRDAVRKKEWKEDLWYSPRRCWRCCRCCRRCWVSQNPQKRNRDLIVNCR